MGPVDTTFAKLAGMRKALADLLNDEFSRKGQRPLGAFPAEDAGPYVERAAKLIQKLRHEHRDLFADAHLIDWDPTEEGLDGKMYKRSHLERVVREIDAVFEIRASSSTPMQDEAELTVSRTV